MIIKHFPFLIQFCAMTVVMGQLFLWFIVVIVITESLGLDAMTVYNSNGQVQPVNEWYDAYFQDNHKLKEEGTRDIPPELVGPKVHMTQEKNLQQSNLLQKTIKIDEASPSASPYDNFQIPLNQGIGNLYETANGYNNAKPTSITLQDLKANNQQMVIKSELNPQYSQDSFGSYSSIQQPMGYDNSYKYQAGCDKRLGANSPCVQSQRTASLQGILPGSQYLQYSGNIGAGFAISVTPATFLPQLMTDEQKINQNQIAFGNGMMFGPNTGVIQSGGVDSIAQRPLVNLNQVQNGIGSIPLLDLPNQFSNGQNILNSGSPTGVNMPLATGNSGQLQSLLKQGQKSYKEEKKVIVHSKQTTQNQSSSVFVRPTNANTYTSESTSQVHNSFSEQQHHSSITNNQNALINAGTDLNSQVNTGGPISILNPTVSVTSKEESSSMHEAVSKQEKSEVIVQGQTSGIIPTGSVTIKNESSSHEHTKQESSDSHLIIGADGTVTSKESTSFQNHTNQESKSIIIQNHSPVIAPNEQSSVLIGHVNHSPMSPETVVQPSFVSPTTSMTSKEESSSSHETVNVSSMNSQVVVSQPFAITSDTGPKEETISYPSFPQKSESKALTPTVAVLPNDDNIQMQKNLNQQQMNLSYIIPGIIQPAMLLPSYGINNDQSPVGTGPLLVQKSIPTQQGVSHGVNNDQVSIGSSSMLMQQSNQDGVTNRFIIGHSSSGPSVMSPQHLGVNFAKDDGQTSLTSPQGGSNNHDMNIDMSRPYVTPQRPLFIKPTTSSKELHVNVGLNAGYIPQQPILQPALFPIANNQSYTGFRTNPYEDLNTKYASQQFNNRPQPDPNQASNLSPSNIYLTKDQQQSMSILVLRFSRAVKIVKMEEFSGIYRGQQYKLKLLYGNSIEIILDNTVITVDTLGNIQCRPNGELNPILTLCSNEDLPKIIADIVRIIIEIIYKPYGPSSELNNGQQIDWDSSGGANIHLSQKIGGLIYGQANIPINLTKDLKVYISTLVTKLLSAGNIVKNYEFQSQYRGQQFGVKLLPNNNIEIIFDDSIITADSLGNVQCKSMAPTSSISPVCDSEESLKVVADIVRIIIEMIYKQYGPLNDKQVDWNGSSGANIYLKGTESMLNQKYGALMDIQPNTDINLTKDQKVYISILITKLLNAGNSVKRDEFYSQYRGQQYGVKLLPSNNVEIRFNDAKITADILGNIQCQSVASFSTISSVCGSKELPEILTNIIRIIIEMIYNPREPSNKQIPTDELKYAYLGLTNNDKSTLLNLNKYNSQGFTPINLTKDQQSYISILISKLLSAGNIVKNDEFHSVYRGQQCTVKLLPSNNIEITVGNDIITADILGNVHCKSIAPFGSTLTACGSEEVPKIIANIIRIIIEMIYRPQGPSNEQRNDQEIDWTASGGANIHLQEAELVLSQKTGRLTNEQKEYISILISKLLTSGNIANNEEIQSVYHGQQSLVKLLPSNNIIEIILGNTIFTVDILGNIQCRPNGQFNAMQTLCGSEELSEIIADIIRIVIEIIYKRQGRLNQPFAITSDNGPKEETISYPNFPQESESKALTPTVAVLPNDDNIQMQKNLNQQQMNPSYIIPGIIQPTMLLPLYGINHGQSSVGTGPLLVQKSIPTQQEVNHGVNNDQVSIGSSSMLMQQSNQDGVTNGIISGYTSSGPSVMLPQHLGVNFAKDGDQTSLTSPQGGSNNHDMNIDMSRPYITPQRPLFTKPTTSSKELHVNVELNAGYRPQKPILQPALFPLANNQSYASFKTNPYEDLNTKYGPQQFNNRPQPDPNQASNLSPSNIYLTKDQQQSMSTLVLRFSRAVKIVKMEEFSGIYSGQQYKLKLLHGNSIEIILDNTIITVDTLGNIQCRPNGEFNPILTLCSNEDLPKIIADIVRIIIEIIYKPYGPSSELNNGQQIDWDSSGGANIHLSQKIGGLIYGQANIPINLTKDLKVYISTLITKLLSAGNIVKNYEFQSQYRGQQFGVKLLPNNNIEIIFDDSIITADSLGNVQCKSMAPTSSISPVCDSEESLKVVADIVRIIIEMIYKQYGPLNEKQVDWNGSSGANIYLKGTESMLNQKYGDLIYVQPNTDINLTKDQKVYISILITKLLNVGNIVKKDEFHSQYRGQQYGVKLLPSNNVEITFNDAKITADILGNIQCQSVASFSTISSVCGSKELPEILTNIIQIIIEMIYNPHEPSNKPIPTDELKYAYLGLTNNDKSTLLNLNKYNEQGFTPINLTKDQQSYISILISKLLCAGNIVKNDEFHSVYRGQQCTVKLLPSNNIEITVGNDIITADILGNVHCKSIAPFGSTLTACGSEEVPKIIANIIRIIIEMIYRPQGPSNEQRNDQEIDWTASGGANIHLQEAELVLSQKTGRLTNEQKEYISILISKLLTSGNIANNEEIQSVYHGQQSLVKLLPSNNIIEIILGNTIFTVDILGNIQCRPNGQFNAMQTLCGSEELSEIIADIIQIVIQIIYKRQGPLNKPYINWNNLSGANIHEDGTAPSLNENAKGPIYPQRKIIINLTKDQQKNISIVISKLLSAGNILREGEFHSVYHGQPCMVKLLPSNNIEIILENTIITADILGSVYCKSIAPFSSMSALCGREELPQIIEDIIRVLLEVLYKNQNQKRIDSAVGVQVSKVINPERPTIDIIPTLENTKIVPKPHDSMMGYYGISNSQNLGEGLMFNQKQRPSIPVIPTQQTIVTSHLSDQIPKIGGVKFLAAPSMSRPSPNQNNYQKINWDSFGAGLMNMYQKESGSTNLSDGPMDIQRETTIHLTEAKQKNILILILKLFTVGKLVKQDEFHVIYHGQQCIVKLIQGKSIEIILGSTIITIDVMGNIQCKDIEQFSLMSTLCTSEELPNTIEDIIRILIKIINKDNNEKYINCLHQNKGQIGHRCKDVYAEQIDEALQNPHTYKKFDNIVNQSPLLDSTGKIHIPEANNKFDCLSEALSAERKPVYNQGHPDSGLKFPQSWQSLSQSATILIPKTESEKYNLKVPYQNNEQIGPVQDGLQWPVQLEEIPGRVVSNDEINYPETGSDESQESYGYISNFDFETIHDNGNIPLICQTCSEDWRNLIVKLLNSIPTSGDDIEQEYIYIVRRLLITSCCQLQNIDSALFPSETIYLEYILKTLLENQITDANTAKTVLYLIQQLHTMGSNDIIVQKTCSKRIRLLEDLFDTIDLQKLDANQKNAFKIVTNFIGNVRPISLKGFSGWNSASREGLIRRLFHYISFKNDIPEPIRNSANLLVPYIKSTGFALSRP